MGESPSKCYFIQGSTGTGKNALAIEVAKSKDAVLVNVDSVQIYKGFQIGANSPTKEEREQVPHYLYNVLEPSEVITAGIYKRMVESYLAEGGHEQLKFFVGGSNFYFKAIEKGMPQLKEIPEKIKQKVSDLSTKLDNQSFWEELKKLSPSAAETLHPNDRYRVERAMLLVLSQDKSPKELEKNIDTESIPLHDYEIIKVSLYLERDELLRKLTDRANKMFAAGLVEEVDQLRKKYTEDCPAIATIGYKEIVQHLMGEISVEEAKEAIIKNSMYLAKRQMTWLKKDNPRKWFHAINEREKAKDYLMTT